MRPEQHVIDEIDRLVSQTMAAGLDEFGHPRDDYSAPYREKCELCGDEWHGERSAIGCPGAYSTAEQQEVWRARQAPKSGYSCDPGACIVVAVPANDSTMADLPIIVREWLDGMNLQPLAGTSDEGPV